MPAGAPVEHRRCCMSSTAAPGAPRRARSQPAGPSPRMGPAAAPESSEMQFEMDLDGAAGGGGGLGGNASAGREGEAPVRPRATQSEGSARRPDAAASAAASARSRGSRESRRPSVGAQERAEKKPRLSANSSAGSTPMSVSPVIRPAGAPSVPSSSALIPLDAEVQPATAMRGHEFQVGRRVFHVHFGHGYIGALERQVPAGSTDPPEQARAPSPLALKTDTSASPLRVPCPLRVSIWRAQAHTSEPDDSRPPEQPPSPPGALTPPPTPRTGGARPHLPHAQHADGFRLREVTDASAAPPPPSSPQPCRSRPVGTRSCGCAPSTPSRRWWSSRRSSTVSSHHSHSTRSAESRLSSPPRRRCCGARADTSPGGGPDSPGPPEPAPPGCRRKRQHSEAPPANARVAWVKELLGRGGRSRLISAKLG